MDLLIAANTLLEFLVNRSQFISEVEYLSEMFESNSSARLYIAEPGLDKIASYLKLLNGLENSEKIVDAIKKRVKVLALTQVLAQEARFSCATNYESAVEVQLAIEANIGAIVTHKPSDFSSEEFTIITPNKLEQRHKLEINYLKNNLPAILVISNLNKALYHLPSYTDIKSLEPKESTSQLDLTCSSDKVSTASTDKLSSQSTPARPLKEIIADSLSNRSAFGRSTASTDVQQYNTLATAHLAHEKHLDDLRTSMSRAIQRQSDAFAAVGLAHEKHWDNLKEIAIKNSRACSLFSDRLPLQKVEFSAIEAKAHSSVIDRLVISDNLRKLSNLSVEHLTLKSLLNGLNNAIASIGNVQSSLVDSPSIKPQLAQSISKLEAARFSGGAIERLTCKSSLDPFPAIEAKAHSLVIDRLVVTDNLHKLSNLPVEHLTLKSSLNGLNNAVASIGNVQSSLVDSPSIKPQLAQSISKLEAARFSGGAIERLTCKSSLDPFQEKIARSGQANSFLKVDASLSDRAGLLSQFKLLESMEKANILDSYLSRQN